MVNEPDNSIGPTLNFFEEYLCIRPRNRQARNEGYVLPECAIRVLIRRKSRGCGIARVHGEELYRSTLHGVRITSGTVWIPGTGRLRLEGVIIGRG